MHSALKDVNTARPRRVNHMLDSEGNIDELASHIEETDQINSRAFKNDLKHTLKDKFTNFRLQYIESTEPEKIQTKKDKELDLLNTKYTKNEYNCQKRHHHNPKTMNKIQTLQDFELSSQLNS